MDHVAIMRKSWKLTEKIFTGGKIVESRWYNTKYPPWNKIKEGDTVYFKDSGCPVTIKADVRKVVQFDDLNPEKVKDILEKYGEDDGLGIDDMPKFYEMFKDKRYCILIFLEDAQPVEPFKIDKSGYGAMASWMVVDDIENIRLRVLKSSLQSK